MGARARILARAPRAPTKDAKVPATARASKMREDGVGGGVASAGRYYRVGMPGCYYSRNSGISPLFKEARYVFRQKVKYFVYDAGSAAQILRVTAEQWNRYKESARNRRKRDVLPID